MTTSRHAALRALLLLPLSSAFAQTAPPPVPADAPASSAASTAPAAAAPGPAALPPIVVRSGDAVDPTRAALAREQALTPGGVTVVDAEPLRERSVTSLSDLLRYVPGVWAARGATGDGGFLSIRGSNLDATSHDGNGVKLLQDGLPVTAADGNNHNRDIDPLAARQAVVARGANALTYGAATLGGAIDFISPTARDGTPDEAMLALGADNERQARVSWGTVAGDGDALVTAEHRHADGFRAHQRQHRSGLYANAGWRLGDGVQTRFFATAIDNAQQLPGPLTRDQWQADPRQAQPAALAGDYQYNVRTWRLANKTTWAPDADTLVTAGLSFESQRLDHPIVHAPPHFSLRIDTRQDNVAGTLRYARRLGAHDLLAGVDLGRTTVTGGNDAYVPGGTTTRTTAVDNQADNVTLFVVDRWQFAPGWTLVAGTQGVAGTREVDNTTVATGARRNPRGRYDSLNPRIGLIRQLTSTATLFANLSRLHEAPTLYELEDDARGDGSTLEAMHGTVVEVGSRGLQAAGPHRWHWDIALYHATLRDEILSRDDPDAPGTSQSVNVGDTRHAGLELGLGASLAVGGSGTHRLEPLVSATVNDFAFEDDPLYGNNRLPAAPRYAVKGEVLYRHASGWFAGPTFDVIGRRFADFTNTYVVDGYTLWGLRAGMDQPGWSVYAELRNAGDRPYVSTFNVRDTAASDAAILTPGAPRTLHVGARVRF